MSDSAAREECVYLAKLAEQAERYDEMVEQVKKIAKMASDQELSVAYKNVIGARRASWRIIFSIEQKEDTKGNAEHVARIKAYRSVVRAAASVDVPTLLPRPGGEGADGNLF